ncbi:MAG: response regulator transcription factor [Acidobacteriota bacterium]|nr:response regulator transcription factor [Acidobacteriota bacterium]
MLFSAGRPDTRISPAGPFPDRTNRIRCAHGVSVTARALLVEDDPLVAEVITAGLRSRHIACDVLRSGLRAVERVRVDRPDVLLLDLSLPGLDGLDVLRQLRRSPFGHDLPIMVVTGRGEETERIVGIEMGADDYVVKPFSVREFTARVGALLRRAHAAPRIRLLRAGGLCIDLDRREVTVEGRRVDLTVREFELLAVLAAAQGRVLRRPQLLEQAWGYALRGGHRTRTVDVHVRSLRAKLGQEASRIVTHKGVGYAWKAGA